MRDTRWQAREEAYHREAIKGLNNQVRKMNALAPQVVRRGLVVLEDELQRVYKDAGAVVFAELAKRRNEDWDKAKGSGFEGETGGNHHGDDGTFAGVWPGGMRKGRILAAVTAAGGFALIWHHQTARADDGREIRTYRSGEIDGNVDGGGLCDEEGGDVGNATLVATSPYEEEETSSAPVVFVRVYILEPILTFIRFLRLAMLFGPVILTMPLLLIAPSAPPRRRGGTAEEVEPWAARWWYSFLVAQMERAGPSFIKLGQWAASRADLFPAALCELMGKLHANGDPHPFHHTKKVLEGAFGRQFEDIFDEFEKDPIGCGAIAQVYRGKLKPEMLPASFSQREMIKDTDADVKPDSSVAVKVVHPRIRSKIRRDLAIMNIFAQTLNLLPGMEWLSLPEEVAVFGDMMNMQLDLRVEADNLEKFTANFAHRGPGISFPRPVKTNGHGKIDAARQVLVEEYEDALPLKYFLRNGGGQYDEKIASSGLSAFLVSRFCET